MEIRDPCGAQMAPFHRMEMKRVRVFLLILLFFATLIVAAEMRCIRKGGSLEAPTAMGPAFPNLDGAVSEVGPDKLLL